MVTGYLVAGKNKGLEDGCIIYLFWNDCYFVRNQDKDGEHKIRHASGNGTLPYLTKFEKTIQKIAYGKI